MAIFNSYFDITRGYGSLLKRTSPFSFRKSTSFGASNESSWLCFLKGLETDSIWRHATPHSIHPYLSTHMYVYIYIYICIYIYCIHIINHHHCYCYSMSYVCSYSLCHQIMFLALLQSTDIFEGPRCSQQNQCYSFSFSNPRHIKPCSPSRSSWHSTSGQLFVLHNSKQVG